MPIKLEQILKRVQDIPPLPSSALRVLDMLKQPETSAKDLEYAIGQDPALTAGILRQANSAFYGYARRISSLQEAIVLLGFQVIQSLAMTAAIAPVLKTPIVGYEVEQDGLWKHSILTGIAAKSMCKRLRIPYADTAFTAGLLHDIGKLIISIYLQQIGDYMLERVNLSQLSYAELEEKVIGFNHATVGGYTATGWNLPDDLVECIAYHHAPEDAPGNIPLVSVVHIADGLANMLGIGGGVDSFLNPIQQSALDRLGITDSDFEHIIAELGEYIQDPAIFS